MSIWSSLKSLWPRLKDYAHLEARVAALEKELLPMSPPTKCRSCTTEGRMVLRHSTFIQATGNVVETWKCRHCGISQVLIAQRS